MRLVHRQPIILRQAILAVVEEAFVQGQIKVFPDAGDLLVLYLRHAVLRDVGHDCEQELVAAGGRHRVDDQFCRSEVEIRSAPGPNTVERRST